LPTLSVFLSLMRQQRSPHVDILADFVDSIQEEEEEEEDDEEEEDEEKEDNSK